MSMESDPIEEDSLERMTRHTEDALLRITHQMQRLELEWKRLRSLRNQHSVYLKSLQQSIYFRPIDALSVSSDAPVSYIKPVPLFPSAGMPHVDVADDASTQLCACASPLHCFDASLPQS